MGSIVQYADELRRKMREDGEEQLPPGQYVIRCESMTGLYWNAARGWVPRESASRYWASEAVHTRLPQGGEWVRIPRSQCHVCGRLYVECNATCEIPR